MPFGFGKKKDKPSPPQVQWSEDHAPGWDALQAAFAARYPGQEPSHWKPNDVMLPAQDGVWGISAYRDDGYWFYVTLGLTDLFELFPADEPDEGGTRWSGFGFEITMRVAAMDGAPPTWPVELLSQLGKYVYQSGQGFAAGHRMKSAGPITGGKPPSRLNALAFAGDPVFESLETPLGAVDFVTVVGITVDELERMKATTTDTVLDELRAGNPQLVTDPSR